MLAGLILVSTLSFVSTSIEPTDCKALLKEFYQFNSKEAAPYTGDNLVYFLHIPRYCVYGVLWLLPSLKHAWLKCHCAAATLLLPLTSNPSAAVSDGVACM